VGTSAPPAESITIARHPVVRSVTAAPYARPLPSTAQYHAWQARFTQRWVQGHLVAALGIAILGVTCILTPSVYPVGMALLGFAVVGLALGALALGWVSIRPTHAAALMVACELVALAVGLALFGPRLEVLVLLPGLLLLAALLAELAVVVAAAVVALLAYTITVILTAQGTVHSLLSFTPAAGLWVDLALVLVGASLFLGAVVLATQQLRAALAGEAAATHTVTVLERRALTKRIAIDADAIALQTQLALALRGHDAQPVATCEDLVPLANMVNAATARVPNLMRDRQERLKMERAVRELTTALETAWAGFTWTWPAPSGTPLDRLVTMLRPSHAQTDTALRQHP
jgi:hypothetical protein